MSKRILFTRPDGGVSIIIPAPEITIARAMQDVPADATAVEIVEASAIPTDRTFRGAWKQQGEALTVDLPKAKEIAHDKRRAKRSEEFAPLDIEATIPHLKDNAESKRASIRAKYEVVESEIDGTDSVEALLSIVKAL